MVLGARLDARRDGHDGAEPAVAAHSRGTQVDLLGPQGERDRGSRLPTLAADGDLVTRADRGVADLAGRGP